MSLLNRLHGVGLLIGAVFFAFSLTPSLLPRPFLIQGLISGLSLSAGYGLGVGLAWLWSFLQLRMPKPEVSRWAMRVGAAGCLILVGSFLWRASRWQASLRELMGLESSSTLPPILVVPVAALVFLLLLGLAKCFRWVVGLVSSRLERHVPKRISRMAAWGVAFILFWGIINGLLVRMAMRVIDRSFQHLDALIEDDLPLPQRPEQTGSAPSLVAWDDLGRQGRRFVAGGPTAEDLTAFFGKPTPAPIRVYVGLNSADSPEKRAQLALKELVRAGGFDRSVLVLVTPTGTGWVDPGSQDTVEYLHRGDIASVAAQYSYLNSPLALLTDAAYGAETAKLMFATIYGHWRSLPKTDRPRLFLSGLSLGSLNSDLSFTLYDIIDDPFSGALWSGPPFRHETWVHAKTHRDAGSSAWLPQFRNGNVIRFMNHHDSAPQSDGWGSFRIIFLQYPSDPITFFNPQSAWRQPDWMDLPRGPDVSPELRWFPVVTMLQVAADMMVGTAPAGFGHEYAPADYLEAWRALSDPPDWSESESARLRDHLKQKAAKDTD
ncbi:MAG: alpha/beta hydrolase [Verrucomicrobiales bacterium]